MNRSSSLRFWAVGIPWYIDPPTKVIFLRASTSTTQPSWTRNSTQIFASQRMVGLAGKYLGLSSLRKDSVPSEEWVVWFDSMTLLVLMIFSADASWPCFWSMNWRNLCRKSLNLACKSTVEPIRGFRTPTLRHRHGLSRDDLREPGECSWNCGKNWQRPTRLVKSRCWS
jgi:hypothetical protein